MKKIAICGKGGSGKSTITTLLANGIQDNGYHVLVIDSDESNSSLYRILGFENAPRLLMELAGGREGVRQNISPKVPVAETSAPMSVLSQDTIQTSDIPPQYIITRDGISLISIGKIVQSLEGCGCLMGVLSREFLKKLHLKSDEIALVDMEAGVEHFGRGVETSVDSIIVVVDPSFESIELAEKINTLAVGIGISNIWIILNKITSQELASKLTAEMTKRNIDVVGFINFDADIFEACLEGHRINNSKARDGLERLLNTILGNKEVSASRK